MQRVSTVPVPLITYSLLSGNYFAVEFDARDHPTQLEQIYRKQELRRSNTSRGPSVDAFHRTEVNIPAVLSDWAASFGAHSQHDEDQKAFYTSLSNVSRNA